MMDTCTQALAVILMLALAGCDHPEPPPAPKAAPPYSACLPRPVSLPPIATVEQVRARHDALDKLYLDCAARLRVNLDALK